MRACSKLLQPRCGISEAAGQVRDQGRSRGGRHGCRSRRATRLLRPRMLVGLSVAICWYASRLQVWPGGFVGNSRSPRRCCGEPAVTQRGADGQETKASAARLGLNETAEDVASRSPGIRRVGGSARSPQRSSEDKTDKKSGLVTAIAGALAALFALRLLFGASLDTQPDTYYYSSSRSFVAVTTYDSNGERKTSVQEDSNVRTNIQGLQPGSSTNIVF
eukprot:TRINITY_DN11687_c0_g3_i2.p1 TRINITY_DN11687_c0_g3~~TRINITY_DN11687_c0_g3_i2.p1  ORF type:complete len:219 (-),score=29.92 TRINITY_DN11687_c0_g3_i2:368-1024(-)